MGIIKKSKQGGARKGAGRKPIDDPKKQLTIFVRKSVIREIGGEEKTKRRAEELLEKSVNNNNFA